MHAYIIWERQGISEEIIPWSEYGAMNLVRNETSIVSEAMAYKIWVLVYI